MAWPLSQEYNEAIQAADLCFRDPELRQAQVRTNAMGLPMPCSGNFADVYQMTGPGGKRWAVKCFTRQVQGLRERYSAISAYLKQANLPFMVDFTYLDSGIVVNGQGYPILKMDWVEGFALNAFIGQNADNAALLQATADLWLKLARRLREAGMAHADLQHGNVLLVPGKRDGALSVRLIDYDGMWVPALAGGQSGEVGHPAYQHPRRLREGTYNAEVDRLPHLVIYTALRALIVGGRYLWNKYDNGDNLLFRQQDLETPSRSPLFLELVKLNDGDVRKLATQLGGAVCKPLDEVPLLDTVVGEHPAPSVVRMLAAARSEAAELTAASMFASTAPGDKSRGGIGPTKKKMYVDNLMMGGMVLGVAVMATLVVIGGLVLTRRHKQNDTAPQLAEGNSPTPLKQLPDRKPNTNVPDTSAEVKPPPTKLPDIRADKKPPQSNPTATPSDTKPEVKRPGPGSLSGRSGKARQILLREGGGDERSETAVAAGLKWLSLHQAWDGHWGLDEFNIHGQCNCGDPGKKGNTTGPALDIAGTGFGLLPFLGAGETHRANADGRTNTYDKVVEKGLIWLILKQNKQGDFGGGMYQHGIASIAMCEAYALTMDPMLRGPAEQAVSFIGDSQNQTGGWDYRSKGPTADTSVSGWNVQALKIGQMAGLTVPKESLNQVTKYLNAYQGDAFGASYGYRSPGSRYTTNAIGLLCRQYLGWGPRNPGLVKGLEGIMQKTPGENLRSMYYYYYATQVVHHMGGKEWQTWNPRMRDMLIKLQDDGNDPNRRHQKGSWSCAGWDVGGYGGGRIMMTSMSLLTLEVYYRYAPFFDRE